MWAVHGGGFYNPQKYAGAPGHINSTLHWFYWESYATWLSGFALFAMMYLWQAPTFLIDTSVMAWSPAAAIATALAFLVGFWLVYDALCKALFNHPQGQAWVGAIMLVLVAVLAGWPTLCWPCRFCADGGHHRHHHDGQCVFLHHSGPTRGGESAHLGPAA
jgi:uncharacterized membrane protein